MNKTTLSILFLMAVWKTEAQELTYYDSNFKKVQDSTTASYFSVLNRDKSDSNIANKTIYYITKEKYSSTNYSNYPKNILHGVFERWNKEGKIIEYNKYKNGLRDGMHLTFWDDGKPKRKDSCVLGNLISGKCFDVEGNEIPYFPYEVQAEFPGGENGIKKYLAEKIIYPRNAIDMNISGQVKVEFVITSLGEVSEVKVVKSAGRELDQEAVRVIKNMPKWKPATKDGLPVRVYYVQPVAFVFN